MFVEICIVWDGIINGIWRYGGRIWYHNYESVYGNITSCDKESLGWNISSPYERDQSFITCVLTESVGSQIA